MRNYHVALDVSLLAEGLRIGQEYGFRSLEELARTGIFLQSAVYEVGSLRTIPGGVTFALHNPPLRMGAFSKLALRWDDQPIPPEDCTVRPAASAEPVRFSEVQRSSPVVFPTGGRIEFTTHVPPPGWGSHTVRLDLRSLAIPPPVWFRLTDHVRSGRASVE
ncbi:MAG: hypothetical protein L3K01_05305 [Thermoplasmata archaeon]|nr:hypothetical protein [Thermoplasmata archaeon]MCI4333124.1 hypothetical protein [Thermoplasmata archaeon]